MSDSRDARRLAHSAMFQSGANGFAAAYGEYVDEVLKKLRVPEDDYEDVRQEVWLAVLKAAPRFEKKSSIKPWIFTIAARVSHRFLFRKKKLNQHEVQTTPDKVLELPRPTNGRFTEDHPGDEVEKFQIRKIFKEEFEKINDENWLLFSLVEIEGWSVIDVAFHFGIPKNTVYTRIRRTKKTLQRRLRQKKVELWLRGLMPFPLLEEHKFLIPARASKQGTVKWFLALASLITAALILGVFSTNSPSEDTKEASAEKQISEKMKSAFLKLGQLPRAPSPETPEDDPSDETRREESSTIFGRVIEDNLQSPLKGIPSADVCIWNVLKDWRSAVCVESDSLGNFLFEEVESGEFVLTASARGFQPSSFGDLRQFFLRNPLESERKSPEKSRQDGTILLTPGKRVGDIAIALRRGAKVLSGIVVDAEQQPISNARVYQTMGGRYGIERRFSPGPMVRTDNLGKFELWASQGVADLWIEADGFIPMFRELPVPSSRSKIQLFPSSTIAGFVRDEGSGEGIPGALVSVVTSEATHRAHSTEDGSFTLSGLPPGRHSPFAMVPGRSMGRASPSILLGIEDSVEQVEILLPSLEDLYPLKVIVSTEDEGKCPSPESSLSQTYNNGKGEAALAWTKHQDGKNIVYSALEDGEYRLLLSCPGTGHEAIEFRWNKGIVSPLDQGSFPAWIQLESEGELRVHLSTEQKTEVGDFSFRFVDQQNKPIPDLSVFFKTRDTSMPIVRRWKMVDSQGQVTLFGVPYGPARIITNADRFPQAIYDLVLGPQNFAEHEVRTIEIKHGTTLKGTILDQHGYGVPGVDIISISRFTGQNKWSVSNEDGQYSIHGLAPVLTKVIISPGQKRFRRTRGDDLFPLKKYAQLQLDQENELNFRVEVGKQSIKGRVVDTSGFPLMGAIISVEEAREGQSMETTSLSSFVNLGAGGSSLSDINGEFTLSDLSPTPYNLVAFFPDGRNTFLQRVVPGQEKHQPFELPEIIVAETGSLEIRLETPEHEAISFKDTVIEFDKLHSEKILNDDFVFSIDQIPPGEYQLRIENPYGGTQLQVQIESNKRHTQTIRLLPWGKLRARAVALDSGEVLASASITPESYNLIYNKHSSAQINGNLARQPGHYRSNNLASGPRVLHVTVFERGYPQFLQPIFDFFPGKTFDLGDIPVPKDRREQSTPPGNFGMTLHPSEFSTRADKIPDRQLVLSVTPGGVADRSGVQVGNRIISIDGIDVNYGKGYLVPHLLNVTAGTSVHLEFEDGKAIVLRAEP